MKKGLLFLIVILLPLGLAAQVRTISGSGNWSNPAIWTGGNIGDIVTENVSMQNGTAATILNGETFNVGNLTDNNNNMVTINAGGTLILGAPGTPRSLTAGNNTTVTVAGTLIIYGDININNNLILTITGAGSVTVVGNVVMNNNATLAVNGSLAVNGDFTGGNNTNVTVNGAVSVGGTTTMGNGSTLTGTGTFSAHGGCTGPAAFCSSGTLPLRLRSFDVKVMTEGVAMQWETVFELDLDKFIVQRSSDGKEFSDIAVYKSIGGTSGMAYQFIDKQPLSSRSYYRLNAVDLDGTNYYYQIKAIDYASKFFAEVYPNPVTDRKLHIKTNMEGDYRILMFDVSGRLVSQWFGNGSDFESPLEAASGFYLLRLEGQSFYSNTRLVVR